jgi:acyl-CoA synthetase (AMP-forming)/AMP-acid ligase II
MVLLGLQLFSVKTKVFPIAKKITCLFSERLMPSPISECINVARYLPLSAEREPNRCAVKVPKKREGNHIEYDERSFYELNAQSDAVAYMLKEQGVIRGMKTLVMVRPGMDLILVVFAMFKLGAVPVVIDPGMGLKHFRACVARTQPEALVGIRAGQWIRRIFRKDFGSIRHTLTVGTVGFRRAIRKWEKKGAFNMAQTQGNELAAILFTSGSTGAPKGVCYEHGMFQAQVDLIKGTYGIEPGETDLPMLPVFALFNPALGTTSVIPDMNASKPATVNPLDVVVAVEQNQISYSFGSPVLWTKIARYCKKEGKELTSLKRILMAGAPVPPALVRLCREVFPNAEVHTPYGATECLPVSTISGTEILEYAEHRSLQGKGTCVGRLVDGVQMKVIPISDEPVTSLEELPLGDVGELVVTGPSVTKMYDKLPDATAAAKIIADDGTVWHRMGDLGYIDENGYIWFCGRKAERVVGDEGQYWLTDCCEAIFNQHARVFRSALIGLGLRGDQKPAIVIEPEEGEWPKNDKERSVFIESLVQMAQSNKMTASIKHFYFYEKFPVDVRHNAKIHRLTLAKNFDKESKS